MIFCDACRAARAWPIPKRITFGVCEICNKGPGQMSEAPADALAPMVPPNVAEAIAALPPSTASDALAAALVKFGIEREQISINVRAVIGEVFEAGRAAERAELATWIKGRS